MAHLFTKHWPILAVILAFIGVSVLVQMNITTLQTLFQNSPVGVSVILFITLGVLLVMIPAASILPLMPLAVALWGWPATAALTLIAWVLGGQILFELSRAFGKPLVAKVLSESQLQTFSRVVEGKGLWHSILVRMAVHGDIISYAFGLFTDISRWEFAIASAIGVAPAAVLYAYFGSLSVYLQFAMIAAIGLLLATYWLFESKKISLHRFIPTSHRHLRVI